MVTMLFLALILGFFFGVRLFAVMIFLCAIGAIASPRSFDAEFSGWMSGFLEMGTGEAANVFSTIPLFIYAIGVLERDGMWVAIGHVCTLVNVVLLFAFSATVLMVLEKIWAWIT